MERPTQATADRFSRTLSNTVLKFHLDDCRSTLYAVDLAMDNLTPRTQQDYWESIKQRYSEHKTLYAQLCQDWSETPGGGDAERVNIKTKLAELRRMFQETGTRIERSDREYVRARGQYEQQKRQYFDDLCTNQEERDATAGRFYSDAQVRMGLSAMDVTRTHVLVTLAAYASTGGKPILEDVPFSAKEGELSSVKDIGSYVSLVDQQGRDFGVPLEIEYDRLHSLDGIIVTLAFARDPALNRRPAQLAVKPSPLGNRGPLALTMPSDQDSDRLARALGTGDLLLLGQSDASEQVDTETRVILCRREGMHLKVPVLLDIHGVDTKCSMLLDTGASVTVLAKSVYNKGLARPFAGLRTIRLKTANGPMTCPVDVLRVSTTAYTRTIPVALTNDSMSLLGANYFAGHRITIDLDRECVYIHPVEKQ
jgi:hypothetical protein